MLLQSPQKRIEGRMSACVINAERYKTDRPSKFGERRANDIITLAKILRAQSVTLAASSEARGLILGQGIGGVLPKCPTQQDTNSVQLLENCCNSLRQVRALLPQSRPGSGSMARRSSAESVLAAPLSMQRGLSPAPSARSQRSTSSTRAIVALNVSPPSRRQIDINLRTISERVDQLCIPNRNIRSASQVSEVVQAIKDFRKSSRLDDLSESKLAADALSCLAMLPAHVSSVAKWAAGLAHVRQCLTPIATEAYDLLSCLSTILSARQQGPMTQTHMKIAAFKQALMHRLPRDGSAGLGALRAIVKHAQGATLDSIEERLPRIESNGLI